MQEILYFDLNGNVRSYKDDFDFLVHFVILLRGGCDLKLPQNHHCECRATVTC